jgi:hypothetical protein
MQLDFHAEEIEGFISAVNVVNFSIQNIKQVSNY